MLHVILPWIITIIRCFCKSPIVDELKVEAAKIIQKHVRQWLARRVFKEPPILRQKKKSIKKRHRSWTREERHSSEEITDID